MFRISIQDFAWIKAQALYSNGNTIEDAHIKARENGYKCGTEAYATFLAGFTEMMNNDFSSA